jgi:hypothetical protein
MTNEDGRHGKKEYEAPKVTRISLRPEEAVLGNCKSPSGLHAGPVSSTCTSGISCNAIGS